MNDLSDEQARILTEALGYPSMTALHSRLVRTLNHVRALFTSILKVDLDNQDISRTGTYG